MARIERVFVEFGGDPSDDKECYKRYTSTTAFAPVGHDVEVLECIPVETVKAKVAEAFRKNAVWHPNYEQILKELGINP